MENTARVDQFSSLLFMLLTFNFKLYNFCFNWRELPNKSKRVLKHNLYCISFFLFTVVKYLYIYIHVYLGKIPNLKTVTYKQTWNLRTRFFSLKNMCQIWLSFLKNEKFNNSLHTMILICLPIILNGVKYLFTVTTHALLCDTLTAEIWSAKYSRSANKVASKLCRCGDDECMCI